MSTIFLLHIIFGWLGLVGCSLVMESLTLSDAVTWRPLGWETFSLHEAASYPYKKMETVPQRKFVSLTEPEPGNNDSPVSWLSSEPSQSYEISAGEQIGSINMHSMVNVRRKAGTQSQEFSPPPNVFPLNMHTNSEKSSQDMFNDETQSMFSRFRHWMQNSFFQMKHIRFKRSG